MADAALPAPIARLSARARALVRASADAPPPEAAWDALARDALAAQREAMPLVDRLLEAQGVGAGDPWWRHAVPTELFKAATLFAGPEDAAVHTFASSGTTDPARRSRAPFSAEGLALMGEAIEVNARRKLFPGGARGRILVLAPPPEAAPAMIMAWGMARLIEAFGLPGSRFLLGPGGVELTQIPDLLASATAEGSPVVLIGASFAFVHLLDLLARDERTLALPPGSRTLDAGGFKGRSREVSPEALREALGSRLGVPAHHAVNLLGMTELASQLYDDALAAHHEGRDAVPGKVGPPWTRTVAVDPATLEPVPHGEVGLLVHLDLANIERPCAVRSSDLGRTLPGGFVILGRAEGAEAAGCSLTVEELLRRGR